MKNEENTKISKAFKTTLENINKYADSKTVIGEPIINGDDIIIPLTNMSIVILSGGGEYGKVNFFSKTNDLPYSVGNGTIVNIKPCAFLIKNKKGDYSLLNVASTSYEKAIDKIGELIKNTNE